jgi:hypothetical protein
MSRKKATAVTEPDPVEEQLKEHRTILDRLLKDRTPTAEERELATLPRPPEPSQFSKQLQADHAAARMIRAHRHQEEAAERQAAWEADAPKRERKAAELAAHDQKIAKAAAELQVLEVARGELLRSK